MLNLVNSKFDNCLKIDVKELCPNGMYCLNMYETCKDKVLASDILCESSFELLPEEFVLSSEIISNKVLSIINEGIIYY